MPPPPVPLRQPHTPHQTGANVLGMPTGRAAKRRSPDDPEENPEKDSSPSGRKRARISGAAPQTPGAQNMNPNGPVISSSTMAPPPMLQQGQQGTPGGGQQQQQQQQQQQSGQPQQAQTPQGQLPSTPQIQSRFMPGPAGMGGGGGIGPGQRPGTASGPLGPMPLLPYTNPGVMNGTKVSMGGTPGVPGAPGLGAGVVGQGGMSMIPQTGPIGNQVGLGLITVFWSRALIRPSYRQPHAPHPVSSTNRALVSFRSLCLTASHSPQCLASRNYNRNRNRNRNPVSRGDSNNSLVNRPCTVARPATRSTQVPPNPLCPLGKCLCTRPPRPLAAPRPPIVPYPVVQELPLVLGLRVV